jgi:hypothetical protein
MSGTDREKVFREQKCLIDALSGQADYPAQFAGERLQAAQEALRQKRFRAISRCWPLLMQNRRYGTDVEIANFFTDHPSMHPDGPAADGALLARYLLSSGSLSTDGKSELAAYEKRQLKNFLGLFRWPGST